VGCLDGEKPWPTRITNASAVKQPCVAGESADKLFMFLSGWLGGPQLYVEKHGHPRLRQRHMPFPIGGAERNQWMLCMRQAMEDVGVPDDLRTELEQALFRTADFMRNKAE